MVDFAPQANFRIRKLTIDSKKLTIHFLQSKKQKYV